MSSVGPAAFLTYAITGVFIVMVMRMLGEMATVNPATGSFADCARQALGGWARSAAEDTKVHGQPDAGNAPRAASDTWR